MLQRNKIEDDADVDNFKYFPESLPVKLLFNGETFFLGGPGANPEHPPQEGQDISEWTNFSFYRHHDPSASSPKVDLELDIAMRGGNIESAVLIVWDGHEHPRWQAIERPEEIEVVERIYQREE